MLPRLLLPLLCLLFLSEAPVAQQESGTAESADGREACPVTKFSDKPFIPPWPYPKTPFAGRSWYGTDRLWIAPLGDGGVWTAQHVSTTDPASGNKVEWWREAKMSWWRQGYDWHVDSKPRLKVTGRRLDATAPPLVAEEVNAVGMRFPNIYMMDSLYFPTLGCWEITGRYDDDELTFVVWVTN